MIQDTESENEEEFDLSGSGYLSDAGSPPPNVSQSPPSLCTFPVASPDPKTDRPRQVNSEFARVKLAEFRGSNKSLASIHSAESFDVAVADVDDDDRMLYLLCARCIAFPFNAKYQLETAPPKPKLNSVSFEKLRAVLVACAEGGEMRAEAELNTWELKHAQSGSFQEAVRWYVAHVLDNQSVKSLCARGAMSCRELENVFETYLRARAVQRGLAKEDTAYTASGFAKLVETGSQLPYNEYVLQTPLVAGGTLSVADQERLYTTFQKILNISTTKHNLLYRICQVRRRVVGKGGGGGGGGGGGWDVMFCFQLGSHDEQEAVVRKELQRRKDMLDKVCVCLCVMCACV